MTTTDQAPEAPPERPQPANVIEALARVAEELPGIGKAEHSEQGYSYRGIEGITRHAQQLFGRYGVVFVPKVLDRQVKDLTINGRPWTEDQLTVAYTVYGPGGTTDKIEVGPLIALGRDNSDKGVNKAMTQAFKYALLQTLCVGDGKDDADREKAHEADAAQPVDPDVQVRRDLRARIAAYPPGVREKVRAFVDEHGIPRVVTQLDDEQVETLTAHLDGLDRDLSDEADPEPTATDAPSPQPEADERPVDAPLSTPAGPDAPTLLDSPAEPQDATEQAEPTAEAVAAAIAHVQAIADKRQVVLELGAHGMATTGNEQSMRKRLALFYAEHPDQLPKGE